MSEEEKLAELYKRWLWDPQSRHVPFPSKSSWGYRRTYGTTCKEYDEFASWVLEQLPSLFHTDTVSTYSWLGPRSRAPSMRLPGRATPDDLDMAIILISEQYVRRCKAISSSHKCKATFCIHRVFECAIQDVAEMEASVSKQLGLQAKELTERDRELMAERKNLAAKDEANAALGREVKALRDKLKDKDLWDLREAALRREITELRGNLEDKGQAEAALRHDVKALREKLEETKVALRKKSEEEEALRVFRKVVGSSATSQRSSDSPTPKPRVFDSYPEERYRPPNPPGHVDSTPTVIPGLSQFPKNAAEKAAFDKQLQDDIRRAKIHMDPRQE